MKIRFIWVGKTKEQFILDGIKKYIKLLNPYADTAITEIKEEKGRDILKMIGKEGERILKLKIPFILLDEKGDGLNSPDFADFIEKNKPSMTFVLGGAYGTSEEVKKMAQKKISLSKMTFTHEMSRLFLLEQTYRAFSIINKRGYHH